MSNVPAVPDAPSAAPVGLEDFDPTTDMATPNLKIVHADALFENTLTGRTFATVEVVPLGVVASRVLFPAEMKDGESFFLCRSVDAKVGTPNMSEIGKFPWRDSGFARKDYLVEDEDGNEKPVVLDCDSCSLKEWGTHPKKDNAPWCNKVGTLILMLMDDEGNYMPALFQMKSSALRPLNNYTSSFFGAKKPLFVSTATLSLTPQKMGTNVYAVPKIVEGDPTDPALHDLFKATYLRIRAFLTTPRDVSVSVGSSGGDPVETTATEATTTRTVEADEEPF
ncbi:MAG: hypothetical protein AB7O86_05590 [Porticoccaceae bacterium]